MPSTTHYLSASLFQKKGFWIAMLINLLWINASEVFRYFAFVMPMMRRHLNELPDVAPMDIGIFLQWGAWDTLLLFAITAGVWLCLHAFRPSIKTTLLSSLFIWLSIFGILWFGLYNMNLATTETVTVALLLSGVELIIAGLIVYGCKRKWP